ncbi:hypothetical protein NKT34_08570 [Paenibacillus polysaccharolyticus]|uniref:hypothetical protein n=1 Tax=Paenibacillus polysaccharolyticus TaxID=582692 RepID=UPI00209E0545|nr:hypothetical protein [Paenibacillus polysaccharolyticus]MCP1133341.1 hypothetical protein [Paenibacillus polysaccharolyticus]
MSLTPEENVKSSVDEMYRQYLNIETIEELYRQAVMMSQALGWELSERRHLLPDREGNNVDPLIYPPCYFQELSVGGNLVYQFDYEETLPLYMKNKPYEDKIRAYYQGAMIEALEGRSLRKFDQAFIYVCHFFSNLQIRDLDNRNRRHLINAIRSAQIIEDDRWEFIEIMDSGYLDPQKRNRIELFITSRENAMNLVEYVRRKAGICTEN